MDSFSALEKGKKESPAEGKPHHAVVQRKDTVSLGRGKGGSRIDVCSHTAAGERGRRLAL